MKKRAKYVVKLDTAAAVSDYSLSYICDTKDLTDHYHHCLKVAVSLDNNFDCLIGDTVLRNIKGIIIDERVPHSFTTPGVNILLNYIKTESVHGNQLLSSLNGACWLDISHFLQDHFSEGKILPDNYEEVPNRQLVPWVNDFLDTISQVAQDRQEEGDTRVHTALKIIDQNFQKDLLIEHVADKIHLSSDRARHIFTNEVGVPMAQYILWKRIRNTIRIAAQPDGSFTDACLKSGFGDQSHFNRAFRRIFVLRPLPIIRKCHVIL